MAKLPPAPPPKPITFLLTREPGESMEDFFARELKQRALIDQSRMRAIGHQQQKPKPKAGELSETLINRDATVYTMICANDMTSLDVACALLIHQDSARHSLNRLVKEKRINVMRGNRGQTAVYTIRPVLCLRSMADEMGLTWQGLGELVGISPDTLKKSQRGAYAGAAYQKVRAAYLRWLDEHGKGAK